MPSSPADPTTLLHTLRRLYDEALGATLNGDLVRTAVLLRENEQPFCIRSHQVKQMQSWRCCTQRLSLRARDW